MRLQSEDNMRIIAYTYEADIHCENCTRLRFNIQTFTGKPGQSVDEHGIPDNPPPTDREGNEVHVVFSTDEGQLDENGDEMTPYCGDCNGAI